jgi:hypothetical protein
MKFPKVPLFALVLGFAAVLIAGSVLSSPASANDCALGVCAVQQVQAIHAQPVQFVQVAPVVQHVQAVQFVQQQHVQPIVVQQQRQFVVQRQAIVQPVVVQQQAILRQGFVPQRRSSASLSFQFQRN